MRFVLRLGRGYTRNYRTQIPVFPIIIFFFIIVLLSKIISAKSIIMHALRTLTMEPINAVLAVIACLLLSVGSFVLVVFIHKVIYKKRPKRIFNGFSIHSEPKSYYEYKGKLLEDEICNLLQKYIYGYKKILRNLYISKDDGTTTEIDIVLIHMSGIYIIEAKNYGGWIFGADNDPYWTQRFRSKSVRFYNPVLQNEMHMKWLHSALSKTGDFPEYSLVVFGSECELKKILYTNSKTRVIQIGRLIPEIQFTAQYRCLSETNIDTIYNILFPTTQTSRTSRNAHRGINNMNDGGVSYSETVSENYDNITENDTMVDKRPKISILAFVFPVLFLCAAVWIVFTTFSYHQVITKVNSETDKTIWGMQSGQFTAGDTVRFGIEGSGLISWEILDISDTYALLISEVPICEKKYNETNTAVSWENCTLRQWLNSEFLELYFTDYQLLYITARITPGSGNSLSKYENQWVEPCVDTIDKAFILSIEEAEYYFINNSARATTYGKSAIGSNITQYWLRSPGISASTAAYIGYDGSIQWLGQRVYKSDKVRPVIQVKFS